MRQLIFVAPGAVEWREAPEPALGGPGEALVRPLAVATCDLDAAMLRGRAPAAGPFPLGHEFVAKVSAVGDEVRGVRVGQRVVVPFAISCGACRMCRRGLTTSCLTVPRGSMYGLGAIGRGWDGALADLVRVPFADAMLVPLPDDIAPETVASAGDNISDAWRTIGPYLAEQPGAPVLIAGGFAASIGLYTVAIAKTLGSAKIDYLDSDARRLALAESLGANAVAGPYPKRLGTYPITVDASGQPDGLACALRSTEPGGVCTSVGIYFAPETPLPLFDMFVTDVTFKTGRAHSRGIIPEVLRLVQEAGLRPEHVTTERASWDEAPEALLAYTTKLVISRD
jgi:alcohol dehydrogenase